MPLFETLAFWDDLEPRTPAMAMAVDEALADYGLTAPILRVYRWSTACVSFGYFGRIREVTRRWPNQALIRRWTGGGEVEHGQDITYALFIPAGHALAENGIEDSYCAVHKVVASLLPGSELATDAAMPPSLESNACFQRPVPHDVIVEGVKRAGAAQRRTRAGVLHQGSVHPMSGESHSEFGQRFAAALAKDYTKWTGASETLEDQAQRLAREKYGTAEWLNRRL